MLQPSLTTIRQPIYEIGRLGTQLLLDLVEGNRKSMIRRFLDVQLVARDSA
jgi:LacI family transcriptional regulator